MDDDMLSLALQRMRNMSFVGLTSHWNLSIDLFHRMFGGETWEGELVNTRKGKYAKEHEQKRVPMDADP